MIVDDPVTQAVRISRFKDLLLIDTAIDDSVEQSRLGSPKKLKGRCMKLEKSYLRLTSAPDPSLVRPLKILKAALEMVKENYLSNDDYSYACDQLKSIRQDITVQCIHGRFAAHVYETHARIALESGDLPEYNQCQSQLQEMRRKGVLISVDEFDCYRILYSIHVDSMIDLTVVMRDIGLARKDFIIRNETRMSRTGFSQIDKNSATNFALDVLASVRQNNTNRFFSLYRIAPLHAGYIMDFILAKQRGIALRNFLRSYLQLPVNVLSVWLEFKSQRSCEKFLRQQGCCIILEKQSEESAAVSIIDCKKFVSTGTSVRNIESANPSIDSILERPLSASREQQVFAKSKKRSNKDIRQRNKKQKIL